MLPVHPIRCAWGVCLKQNPHIFQHLRSATLHSFVVLWWHPGPVPTLAPCGRLQIASLTRRTFPRCSIHYCADGIPLPCSRQPRSMLTKTPKPSNICSFRQLLLGCMRERRTLFNLLHEYWSRSPNLLPVSRSLACSTTVVILAHLRNTLRTERIGRPYVNPQGSHHHKRHDTVYLHPTN